MKQEKFSIQILIKSVPESLLWNYVSTAEGLSQWFATTVTKNADGTMTFDWNGIEQRVAKVVKEVPEEEIVFHWMDSAPDEFWSFDISVLDLTDDTVLTVTDYSSPEDIEDDKELWISQIEDLKHIIGC